MKIYILGLADRIDLPREAALYALEPAAALEGTDLLHRCWESVLAKGSTVDLIRDFAAENHWELNRVLLALTLLLTRNMREEYIRKGIDLDIYENSLKDIAIWAKCCKDETGLWGMKQFYWLQNTLGVKLWRLGRLQFEHGHFEAERFEQDGIVLHKGDHILNVHIPEGTSVTPEVCEDAFGRAVSFFGSNIFACESWMLWPTHREILKPESNILRFMNYFTIIDSWESEGVNDLWRIFGYLPDYSPEKLPRHTSLQRGYANHLAANGGKSGGGYGICVYPTQL